MKDVKLQLRLLPIVSQHWDSEISWVLLLEAQGQSEQQRNASSLFDLYKGALFIKTILAQTSVCWENVEMERQAVFPSRCEDTKKGQST